MPSFLSVRDKRAVQANPLDPECEAEGKVVCSQGHIKGEPGDLHMLLPHLSTCQSTCQHLQDPLHRLPAQSNLLSDMSSAGRTSQSTQSKCG